MSEDNVTSPYLPREESDDVPPFDPDEQPGDGAPWEPSDEDAAADRDDEYTQEAFERAAWEQERKIAEVIDLPGYKSKKEREAEAGGGASAGGASASNEQSKQSKPPEPGTWDHDLATALKDIRAKLAATSTSERQPLFGDAVDLLARHFDGARWLITGLVTRNGVTMIGGEPKTAKTWIALELAIAVATGTKVFGEFFAEEGTSAYFFAEDLDVQVRNRTRALLAGAGRNLARGRLHLRPRGVFIDVTRDEDLAWIVASARKLGKLDLLVLDPLRDVHSGEEDKSDSMRNVMRRLRVVAELLDCTIAVVHHAPKATKDTSKRRPGQNLRGSSAIHGSVDSGLYLEDSGGDGTNVFTNSVTSQVKGARSSGKFEVRLSVTDDAASEAETAGWTYSRVEFEKGGTGKKAHEKADDDAVFDFVRRLAMTGVTLSRTGLREHDERPVSEKKLIAALDRMIESGRLVIQRGTVQIPQPSSRTHD